MTILLVKMGVVDCYVMCQGLCVCKWQQFQRQTSSHLVNPNVLWNMFFSINIGKLIIPIEIGRYNPNSNTNLEFDSYSPLIFGTNICFRGGRYQPPEVSAPPDRRLEMGAGWLASAGTLCVGRYRSLEADMSMTRQLVTTCD